MSDSSPEDFMQQALALITELKKALEASFAERENSIAAINTKYESLDTKFQQHENNHVSKSSVDFAINAQISSHSQQHNLKLREIDAGFISVATYKAKIEEFEGRIATLENLIETIKKSIAQSEEGKIESKVPKVLIETSTQSEVVTDESAVETTEQQSDDVYPVNNKPLQEQTGATPPSDENGEDNTTTEDSASSEQGNPLPDRSPQAGVAQLDQHTTPPSATSATIHAKNDPNVSDLKTAILQAIQSSSEYKIMINNKRHKILNQASDLKNKNPSINDDILCMQVIIALHYLRHKPSKPKTKNISIQLYKGCYKDNQSEIDELQNIVTTFIGENMLKVTSDTFQQAISDPNFRIIMTVHEVVQNDKYDALIDDIKKP
jgi:hypothetical protein